MISNLKIGAVSFTLGQRTGPTGWQWVRHFSHIPTLGKAVARVTRLRLDSRLIHRFKTEHQGMYCTHCGNEFITGTGNGTGITWKATLHYWYRQHGSPSDGFNHLKAGI